MDAHLQVPPFDPSALNRLSPGLITSHHQNDYGGAVRRLNAIRAQLPTTAFATAAGSQLDGLKREELIATHSMLLHELYFGSLGGDGVTMEAAAKLMLEASFGSVEHWREEFIALGKAAGGGSGWVLLVFQPREGSLVNQFAEWAAELADERDVVVYCVYGHEVSRATALRLRAAGLHARYLRGGIDGWPSAHRTCTDKPAGPMA